jgi:hypothetical protein
VGEKGVPLSHRRFATRMSSSQKKTGIGLRVHIYNNMPDRMLAVVNRSIMFHLKFKMGTSQRNQTHPLLAVSNSHEQSDTASLNEIDMDEEAVANDRALEIDRNSNSSESLVLALLLLLLLLLFPSGRQT